MVFHLSSGSCAPASRLFLPRVASGATLLSLTLLLPHPALAQDGTVTGRVLDAEIGEPLVGVVVELTTGTGRVVASGTSRENGEYRLTGISPGRYSLLFSTLGYETQRKDRISVRAGIVSVGDVELVSRAFRLNPIVVTASRVQEKALDAPASIYSVDTEQIEERPATAVIDHIRGLPGLEVITSGLARHSVGARGFNTTWNNLLFLLTDYRWASVPSLRFNAFNLLSYTNDDIERIELVLGPGSALYGPNTTNGVMHIITKSPLDHQGTTVSLTGGERDMFQGELRHAGLFSENVGYKISGLYFRGEEWKFTDPVEEANRQAALAAGASADTLLIGRRDFGSERFTVDGRLDFRLADQTTLVLSGGVADLINSIEQATTGTVQVANTTLSYAQARFRRDQFFAQAYVNWTNTGDTYALRSGAPLVENSLLYSVQAQHVTELGERQRFVYGADLFRTVPRTEGTIHGRNEDDDNITEIGGYVQSETQLSPLLDLVAAARVDHHSVIDDVVFSPRLGLVLKPADGHNLRVTYNRAFRQPTGGDLFIDGLALPTLGGLPFPLWASSPSMSFRRDCSSPVVDPGLCMRSPFTPDGFGGPSQFLPLDATLFWDAAVQIVGVQNPEAGALLGLMNQPNATQVGTVMRTLDLFTSSFDLVTQVADVEPLKPAINNTIEAGYKGLIGDRLFLGVDVYYTRIEDFISTVQIVTPNVFLDPASVGAYIASEAARLGLPLTPETIEGLTEGMASVPLATVTPEESPNPDNPASLVFSVRNYPDVDYWGADVGASFLATDEISFSGSYSFLSENFFENIDGVADVPLNAPKHKASLAADYRNQRLGLAAEVRGRYIDGFRVASGFFVGDVESYTLFDALVTYALPFSRGTQISLSGVNIFDNRHQEVPGAPFIGRTVLLRVRQSF